MSDDKKSASGANTRWWESYLVRYFSGAVVGAICLTVILMYADWRLYKGAHTTLSMFGNELPFSALAFGLIAGGLVFSYIISAPITVIHFGRSGRSASEQHVRYFWLGWVITLVSMQLISALGEQPFSGTQSAGWMLLLMVSVCYLISSHYINAHPRKLVGSKPTGRKAQRLHEASRNRWRSLAWGGLLLSLVVITGNALGLKGRPAVASLFAFSLPTLFVGVMQYVTLFRIFNTEKSLHRFYRLLTRARTMDNSRDIRETYTHLREHSNATFIVLLELCFSAFLLFLVEIYAGRNVSGQTGAVAFESENMVNAVLLLVAFWMTPNLFMWSRANQIERDFSRHPKLYAAIGRASATQKADPVVQSESQLSGKE